LSGVGWLLDVAIGDRDATLWVKLDDGRTVHLTDRYRPAFYVELREGIEPEDMAQIISLHPDVFEATVEVKYTSILNREKSKVVHVVTCDTPSFRVVRHDLEKLDVVRSWFNVDLYHFQRYLFAKAFAPTSKVAVKWRERGALVDVAVIDDSAEITPPPFAWLRFEASMKSARLTPDARWDPVAGMTLRREGGEVEVLNGAEADILTRFASRVDALDPDILIASEYEQTLPYLLKRAEILGLDLQLGREAVTGYNPRRVYSAVRGRALVDAHAFATYGVAGICEFSRFTLAPPTYAAQWAAGKRIDARQSFEALQKDILVPKRRGFPRFAMTARAIHEQDKGGLLFSPVVGLHANVAELDFESMFPNIIIHHNVSYETVTPTHVDRTRPGFLGAVVQTVLDRRLRFKHLRKQFPKESAAYRWCEQRQTALKCVLVCIYGFSGCFANRFNNVAAYNEINAVARRILVQTVNLCLTRGFEVLYGNTDSLFVTRPDATRDDYEALAETIRRETGLPMSLDHHYAFIVFMRQATRPDVEAMNHFFGKLTNGDLNCRGIELRRRDCPSFVKAFQRRLIEILFDADDAREVMERQVAEAKAFVHATYQRIREGGVDPSTLVISKRVRRDVNAYTAMFPHVVAAKHLTRHGKRLDDFETVGFIYTNAAHRNPMRRVLPAGMLGDGGRSYDRAKYGQLLLDVADTVLKTVEPAHASPVTLEGFLRR
jgi:DNA polymerase elongation subunit (family B)